MAAFTTFSHEALSRYLIMFDVGQLVSFEETVDGIENSNYFVTVEKHGEPIEYVLTLMESLTFDDLPFFNNLTGHLSHYGLPVSSPRRTLDGMSTTIFCGKPALLFDRLPGQHLEQAHERHCTEIGKSLAELHDAVQASDLSRGNPYDQSWLDASLATPHLDLTADERSGIQTLLDSYRQLAGQGLPSGVIHGDLFLDNALFEDDELSGIIDFYHACDDYLVQDLAIAINDWCKTSTGIDQALASAMVAGYESERALSREEHEALPLLQAIGALRFFLTRSLQQDEQRKDPAEYRLLMNQLL